MKDFDLKIYLSLFITKILEFDLRMVSPNFGSIPKIVIRIFMVTNPSLPRVLIT